MSDLSAAAAALGVPEPIVQRSAAARAAASGTTVEEILAAWAGGEAVAGAPAPPAEEPAPVEEAPAEETTVEAPPPAAEPVPAATVPAEAAQPAAVTRSPIPSEVTAAEAATLPEVVTVPTAGIRERTNFALPRWLAAVMIIIPAFALFALGGSATGECGSATELTTDVISGEVVNCDGSEFTGSGIAGGGTDFIAMGEELYNGAPACAGCHGPNGGGSGAIPALTGVLTTFGACTDHIEWVALGSAGFQAAGETTYGDPNKPINGGMPTFETSLSEEQIAAVAAFERVRFGGGDPAEVLADCGLAEEEGGEGAEGEEVPAEEGEAPTDTQAPGEEETVTTVSGAEATAGRTP